MGLKDRTKTSLDDELTLLLAVGRDCVGDVTIVPEGEDPDAVAIQELDPLFDVESLMRRARNAEDPVALAGVQEKVSSQMLTIPFQDDSGPAIIKFGPETMPRLVQNEHFFLRMAAACGVPAATSSLMTDSRGTQAISVKRLDRRQVHGAWRRLAQEDGCQLTNSYPSDKYRLSIRHLAEVTQQYSAASPVALNALLRQLAFSYMIGNSDLHAKNFSLGETELGWMPTPAYDLVSTLPYKNINQRMALTMDGRDDGLRTGHFVDFFGRYGIPERAVLRSLGMLYERSGAWIPRLSEIGFDAKVTEQLATSIAQRREALAPSRRP